MNGIYSIRNKVNGMVYVGSTKVSFEKRWKKHLAELRAGNHINPKLQNDWDKYGESNFSFEILEEGFVNLEQESEWIMKFVHHCYNTRTPVFYPSAQAAFGKPTKSPRITKIHETRKTADTERTTMNLSPSEQAFWDFCRQWLIERDEAAETEKTAEEENTAAVEEPLQN